MTFRESLHKARFGPICRSMGMDPMTLSLIGMAVQAAGTMQQREAANDERDQRTRRMNQAADEQAGYARQNAARVAQTTQQVGADQQKSNQAADTAKLTAQYAPAAPDADVASFTTANPGAPKEISTMMADEIGRSMATSRKYAASKGAMDALNLGGINTGVALNRSAQDIATNNNRAQGAWGVMNHDLNSIYPNQGKMAGADALNGIGSLFATEGLRQLAKKPKASPAADLGGSDAWY